MTTEALPSLRRLETLGVGRRFYAWSTRQEFSHPSRRKIDARSLLVLKSSDPSKEIQILKLAVENSRSLMRYRQTIESLARTMREMAVDRTSGSANGVIDIQSLEEVNYEPEEEVVEAYKLGHRRVFRSFLQRWLLSTPLSDNESVRRLQDAAYAGISFYIGNHLDHSEQFLRLNTAQTRELIHVIGRYLGNVADQDRAEIAGRVVADLLETLQGKKFSLLTGSVSSDGTEVLVRIEDRLVQQHPTASPRDEILRVALAA